MFLYIDTATEYSGTAISDGITCSFRSLKKENISDNIIQNIDDILSQKKISLGDIKGVFAITGPGSFTGLRVGISVANQFAHQLSIPITGIKADTLYSYISKDKDFVYLQSMNKDQVYISGVGDLSAVLPARIISVNEALYDILLTHDHVWSGQLSPEHRKIMSAVREAEKRTIEEACNALVSANPQQVKKKYELLEPYYAKDPTITPSTKNRLL